MTTPANASLSYKKQITGISTGSQVLTVGAGPEAMYATIQDAVNFVEAQVNFIDTGNASLYQDVGGGNFIGHAVGEWANGSNEITLSPTVGTTNLYGSTRQWLQAGSENQLYRLLSNKKDAETIFTDCIRIGTTITGATDQITIYHENMWTIFLLDSYYDEHVVINANVCIKFDGLGATWVPANTNGAITKGANFDYGVLEFGNLLLLSDGNGPFLDGNVQWNAVNTIELRFLANCVLDTWQSDFMSPDIDIGSVFIEQLRVTSRPVIANSHLFVFDAKGSIEVAHIVWNIDGTGSGVLEASALLFDNTRARKIVIGHVLVNIESSYNIIGDLAIIRGGSACKEIHVSNVSMSSKDDFSRMESSNRISIVDMHTDIVPINQPTSDVFITNCHLNFPNAPQGQIQLYRGKDLTTSQVSIANCSGGAIVAGSNDVVTNKNADAVQTFSYNAVLSPDANLGGTVIMELTGDVIVGLLENPQIGQKVRFIFNQDSFGGHVITVWGSTFIVNNLGAGGINETAVFDFEYILVDGTTGEKWVQTNTAQWI